MAKTLERFDYALLGKPDKGLLRRFLAKATGLSRAQVTRLLHQHRTTGGVRDRRGAPGRPFTRRYTRADAGLPAETDALHGTLSGPATRALCARAFRLFGDSRFERLAGIIQRPPVQPAAFDAVRPAPRGRRRRRRARCGSPLGNAAARGLSDSPAGCGVDTVHQGDLDGIKGLYHVNLVDEVTQFQFIGSVEHIHAACLGPVLEALPRAFPFTLHGFHTDNGSEFVNREVAALLETLRIEFAKSRARRSTDNALVEGKNGSVVRKHLGHGHIPGRWARQVNAFTQQVLSPYLNFHRPCFFPREQVDARGRVRKRYRHADVMTPYEKAQVVARRRRLPEARNHLRPTRRRRRGPQRQRGRPRPQPGPRTAVSGHQPGGLRGTAGMKTRRCKRLARFAAQSRRAGSPDAPCAQRWRRLQTRPQTCASSAALYGAASRRARRRARLSAALCCLATDRNRLPRQPYRTSARARTGPAPRPFTAAMSDNRGVEPPVARHVR